MPPPPVQLFALDGKSHLDGAWSWGDEAVSRGTEHKPSRAPENPPGMRGSSLPFPPISITVKAGMKCKPRTHHAPQPDPQALCLAHPHFVFTRNWFLIKFDFSSHLFRRAVPFGSGKHRSGDRLATEKSEQSRALQSILFWRGKGLGTGLWLENCSCPRVLVHRD